MNYFWSHTIWYVLLGITTLFELLYVFIQPENRSVRAAFYLSILGIVLIFETIILIFLKSYYYYPMVIHSAIDPFNDMLAGNLFSQFSVSATALLLTTLSANYYCFFIVSGTYSLIEEAFIALGIFKHNWYQTWMTFILMPVYFWLAKKMYVKIIQGLRPVYHYLFVFLGLFPLYVITLMRGLQLSGHIAFSKTLFSDPISSWYSLALALLFVPEALVMMFIYFARPELVWKLLLVGCYIFFIISAAAGNCYGSRKVVVWLYPAYFLSGCICLCGLWTSYITHKSGLQRPLLCVI